MKIECDICKKVVDEKNIFHLSLSEPAEENIEHLGNGVFSGTICKDCAKKVFQMFRNKIWISNNKYKKQLKVK